MSNNRGGIVGPNIVLIVADDLGYADVGFTQRVHHLFEEQQQQQQQQERQEQQQQSFPLPEVKTPNIDALAEDGVVFTSGHVSGQVCSPTRAGLMLGRYQQGIGIYSAGDGGSGMPVLKYDFENQYYQFVNPWITHFLKPGFHQEEGANGNQWTNSDSWNNDNGWNNNNTDNGWNSSDSDKNSVGNKDYVTGVFGKWHLGVDEGLRTNRDGIYFHSFNYSSRARITYELTQNNNNINTTTDVANDGIVFPNNGPLLERDRQTAVTEGIPDLFDTLQRIGAAGSPYHPLYRGFDVHYNFMGRGSKDYWSPNGIYESQNYSTQNLGKSHGLDDRNNPTKQATTTTSITEDGENEELQEEPTSVWDADQPPYFIHNERIPDNYLTNNITKAAVNFIKSHASGNRPFFAYVPYNAPHKPLQAPYHMNPLTGELDRLGTDNRRYNGLSREDFAAQGIEDAWFHPDYTGDWFPDPLFIYETYKDQPHGLKEFYGGNPKKDQDRRTRAITMSMVRWMDKGVGEIVAALKDPNGDGNTDDSVYSNTLIVFISDNGGAPGIRASNRPLRGGKNTILEGGHRTPFVLTWNNFLQPIGKKGTKVDVPVTSLDLLSTFLDANGWNDVPVHPLLTNHRSDGKSLLPLIDGTVNKLHDYLFWADGEETVEGAVRKDNWKLILFRRVVLETNDAIPTFELFDLDTDLGEEKNLAPCFPDLVHEMTLRFLEFMELMALRSGENLPNRRLPAVLQNYNRAVLPTASPGECIVNAEDGLEPTVSVIDQPTSPTNQPQAPSDQPSMEQSQTPSQIPSDQLSTYPSQTPTNKPSTSPSQHPSDQLSTYPSQTPTNKPSTSPSQTPSNQPSTNPSQFATDRPSINPSLTPTDQPTLLRSQPTDQPTLPNDQPRSWATNNRLIAFTGTLLWIAVSAYLALP